MKRGKSYVRNNVRNSQTVRVVRPINGPRRNRVHLASYLSGPVQRHLARFSNVTSLSGRDRKRDIFAPKRAARKAALLQLQEENPRVYKREHSCEKEYSKLNSWRAAQGPGGRVRSRRELANNKRNFKKRDC